MKRIKVLVLSGYGINCEEETKFAFELAGAKGEIVHINDLISGEKRLKDYQIMAFPGGFSYGDDTGAGNAFANRMRNNLWEEVVSFVKGDNLVIGICNGFQIIVNLGLLPSFGSKYGERKVALIDNDKPCYIDRWVDLKVEGNSYWLKGIEKVSLPIAHGEGKFFALRKDLEKLEEKKLITLKYVKGRVCRYQGLEVNPNGSLKDIAGISDESGRILGLMPHPERAIFFHHLPYWQLLKEKYKREGRKVPLYGPGLKIFKNGASYFK